MLLDAALAVLAILSGLLTLWRWWASERFPLHAPQPAPESLPGLTVLKPLKDCNSETRRCLKSWFEQRYPGPIQILFGVASIADPVCDLVRELIAEFPSVDARLLICGNDLGANQKVSTLRQLEPHIRHPLVMVSDADVEVPPHFTATLGTRLAAPDAGLVNCFYRLANPSTLAMQWEAIAINADFWSQVLQARILGPIDFALGAVMSVPLAVLQKIGGFAPLADYLADDYELGRRVARAGGKIDFVSEVAGCREGAAGWKEVWTHQVRWARTIRACRPVPYFMSALGNATLWPVLWLALGTNPLAAPFCLGAILFRIITAGRQQARLTRSNAHWAFCWMTPMKDILDLLVWAEAFLGNTVVWRGEGYRILEGGKLLKLARAKNLEILAGANVK